MAFLSGGKNMQNTLSQAHRILLSISVSAIVLTAQSNAVNAQQARPIDGTTEIFHGPVYTDLPGGGESVISYGLGSLAILEPLNGIGRITAGSAQADGGGIIAYDTDFTGGSRTGAAVIARHQNTSGGAFIDLYNSTITTVMPLNPTHASRGLEARHSHTVTMTGGSITSRLNGVLDPVGALTWSGSNKVTATNTLATIILSNVDVNVSDIANTTAGTGVASVDGGQILVKDGSNIIVGHQSNAGNKGINSVGKAPAIRAELANTPSLVTVSDSSITVHGNNSFGAILTDTGDLVTSNTDFLITGNDSIGVSIAAGSMAGINGGTISTTGANTIGLALDGAGIATLSNTKVESHGIVASFTGVDAEFTADNSTLTGNDGVFSADSANASITLTDSSATTEGGLLKASSGSDIELIVNNSALQGDIDADDTSAVSLGLNHDSTLIGAINAVSGDLLVDATSQWKITGNSSLNLLSNDGTVSFAEIVGDTSLQSNYRTLNVIDYNGDNGAIHFNTHLGDDTSATDQLIADNVTGTTTITVKNTGGLGAQTDEGIELIKVGSSASNAFTLAGDYSSNGSDAVVAGAYAYRLHKGNASGSNDTDWFLRSELKDGTTEYQAGAPVYEVYSQALLGLNGVSTLQQRVGNRVWAGNGNNTISQGADVVEVYAPVEEAGAVIEGNGIWGRMEGSHTHMEPNSSTTGTRYNQDIFKIQAGIDGMLNETESGKLIGGVQLHYVHGNTKTKSTDYADGKISTDGYGFSGTLTWYDENGFYADGQAQFTWYDSDLTTSASGAPTLEKGNNGFGYTLSMETGKRVAINDTWSITPQGQLVYSHVKFDDFTDAFGANISLDRAHSLQGRLGITLDRPSSWQNTNGMISRSNVYGIANMYYEFLNGTKVDVAGVSFANKNDRLWAGVGLGGSYNWNDDKYSIYGEGLINTSLNNFGDSYTVKGNIGFRVKW